jgi:hypothetical protein
MWIAMKTTAELTPAQSETLEFLRQYPYDRGWCAATVLHKNCPASKGAIAGLLRAKLIMKGTSKYYGTSYMAVKK